MNNTEKPNSKGKSCKDENRITVSATYGEKSLTGFETLLELNVATSALLIFFLTVALFGNKTYAQDTCSEKMIVGETNLKELQQIPEFWAEYRKNYDSYSIDEKIVEEISNLLDSTKYEKIIITAVIGTWCGDTKEQFPVFQKIFDRLQHQKIRIEYVGVDRGKLAGKATISPSDAEFVPTFVFSAIDRSTSEAKIPFLRHLGRIVETPEGTMEEHILKILSGKE